MTPGWLNSFLLPYHLLLTVEPVTLLGFLLDLVISAGVGFPSTQQTYCTLHFVPDFPHIVCLFYYASSNYPKEPCCIFYPSDAVSLSDNLCAVCTDADVRCTRRAY